jgi:hypothetical protein
MTKTIWLYLQEAVVWFLIIAILGVSLWFLGTVI